MENKNRVPVGDLSTKTAFLHVIVIKALFKQFASYARILIHFASPLLFWTSSMTGLIANTSPIYAINYMFGTLRSKNAVLHESTNYQHHAGFLAT